MPPGARRSSSASIAAGFAGGRRSARGLPILPSSPRIAVPVPPEGDGDRVGGGGGGGTTTGAGAGADPGSACGMTPAVARVSAASRSAWRPAAAV
jgi:hypothetical protein